MPWNHFNFQGEPIDPFASPPKPTCVGCGLGDGDPDGLLPELYWDESIGQYVHEKCMQG